MKLIKKLMVSALLAASSIGAAQAANINVGGVSWDPDSPFDFSSMSLAIRQVILQPSGELTGYGYVSQLNNKSTSSFCPGCEMTFQFSGFMPVASGALPTTPGTAIGYKGGEIDLYVHTAPTGIDQFDPTTLNSSNTGTGASGSLWLKLTGHSYAGTTFTGNVNGNIPLNQISYLQGGGLVDAAGGIAQGYFNTNTKTDGADMAFSATFTQFLGNNAFDAYGTGNFAGDSSRVPLPEPGTLALFGLGLLGAGLVRRRNS